MTPWANHDLQPRAAAIIIRDGQLLLMRRVREGREYYIFPGGRIEAGETPEQAAVREVEEEFGLNVTIDRLLFELPSHGKPVYYFLISDAFIGEPVIGGPELEQMHEGNQYHAEWIALSDLGNFTQLHPKDARLKLAELLVDVQSL